ncbi:MAG: penicillin acylase family protein [Gemmatimonadetes bacterium]|nr:penicillin acylase family protein [Gemmatimonadota bacterium]
MRFVRSVVPFAMLAGLAATAQGQPTLEAARGRLAVIEGRIRTAGLDSVVEVRRDRWGIPHIYAKTVHDLFFAQGYVAAQDRLWQMEMWRRQGDGLLAEVLGPGSFERDKFARLLKYRGDMDQEWASYAPDTKLIVQAFVHGVNTYIQQVRDNPPIEFALLGFKPEPWNDRVPLQRMAALSMTGNALNEVDRAHLVATYGKAKIEALFPLDPVRTLDPAPGLDLTGIGISSLGAAAQSYGSVTYQRLDGSNNWVVSGKRTATGKPLLANDPHRSVTLPALRYLTHLVGPGWNVIGAGEPGVPGVAGGHNERIAFGFTIVGMDQQDVYVEKLGNCPGAKLCYWNRGAWKPVRVLVDTIPVKGEAPRIVDLEFTEHGPIVAKDSTGAKGFVIRFVGSEPGTAGYLAQISINRATDWRTFKAAAYRWKLPTENLIYADVDGNIGWIAAGLNPIRSWSGLLPVPGDGRYEWQGFLPFSQLPQTLNPPDGIIATANHNIMPKGYPHQLNYEWATAYRADRIKDMLGRRTDWTRTDFERLQHDEHNTPASLLVPVLVGAAKRRGAMNPAIDLMARWDFLMRKDAAQPVIFTAWLRALGPMIYQPRLGDRVGRQRGREWDTPNLIRLVTRPDRSFGATPAASRDSVVLAAFDEAMAQLTKEFPGDPASWRWGSVHTAAFRHPIAPAFDLPSAARGGDENTVNMTGGTGWRQTAGASYRGIFDTADWDNSVATTVPGQSGQPGSPFYDNLLPLWTDYRYFPLVYSRPAVERETKHLLWLEPQR